MRIRELRVIAVLSFLVAFTGTAFAAKTELSEDAVRVADEINLRNMRATVSRLTALPTRVTGYEAGENAAKYIFDEFQRMGLEDVDSQEYEITVPIDHGDGKLRLLGEDGVSAVKELKLSCLWPNLVRTSFLPKGIKHKVEEEDTLESIAASYGISVDAILEQEFNNYLTDQATDKRDNNADGQIDEEGEMVLFPDKDILIPIAGVTGRLIYAGGSELSDFNDKEVGGVWHVVKVDETIDDIAHRYRVGVGAILDDILNLHLDKTNDDIDNDNDGEIDEDGEMPLMEDIAGWDKDGIDNDNDGLVDEVPGDESGEFVEARESAIFIPQGSIVLLDFNCTVKWINAAMLGASAVIFIEPEDTIRGEAEAKFLTIPAAIPRFWISQKDADYLIENYLPEGGVENNVQAQLIATMTWERKLGQNITGLLPGTDPDLRGEMVVIQAYFDSMSVVPADAPGADPTCGIAAMMEIARVLSMEENRPGRSVLFLATSGHFQGLAGMRGFMYGVSEDLVETMYELRDDLYNDLREIRVLGRRIVLAIGKGLLVELPPSFFERVQKLEDELWALRNDTLPELRNVRNAIASLRNNKRDEIEKKKERRERTKKREEEKFTPEDQARLEALTAKATADSIQTAYHFEKLVDELMELKEEAIAKCREEEKAILRDRALPMANMDKEIIDAFIEEHENLDEYTSRHPWMYGIKEGEKDPTELIDRLKALARQYGGELVIEDPRDMGDKDVEEIVKQYSYGKIADRHLDALEYMRLKKARKTLWKTKDEKKDYKAEEISRLQKVLGSVEEKAEGDTGRLDAFLAKLGDIEQISRYTDEDIEFFEAHLSEDKILRLDGLRRRALDTKDDDAKRKYLAKEKDILMLARYNAQNAPRFIKRLLDLVEQDGLTREYTVEEARLLEYNLGEDYKVLWNDDKTGARQVLFARYDEGQLLERIRSRATNDVADLEAFEAIVDTIDRPTTEQEMVLMRDNLPTLRNSRIRNIHKKIGILSRIDRGEYAKQISLLMQVINLQDQFNRYYSSLFI
ncbi:LysM peptidoglycan-binding domain-containing protein, partial [Candidatus Poribacteria bacterium]